MMRNETRGSLAGVVVCLVALVFLWGCAKESRSALTSPPPPPGKLDVTNIRSQARDIKHEGVVNKRLVRYLLGQRMYVLALQHTEELLRMDHQDAELYFLKGFAFMELGKHDEAIEELKTALELHRGYATAWNALGMAYDLMGERDEAEQAYLEALRINPVSPKYLNNLGFSYFSRGKYDRAVELYVKALASDPHNVQIHNNLGFAYGMLGRYPEAMAEFKQAGRDEVAYNNVGFLYHMLGFDAEAKLMYAKALQINPRFIKARRNLSMIEGDSGASPLGPELKGMLKP